MSSSRAKGLIHLTRGILSEIFYWLTQDTTVSLRRTTKNQSSSINNNNNNNNVVFFLQGDFPGVLTSYADVSEHCFIQFSCHVNKKNNPRNLVPVILLFKRPIKTEQSNTKRRHITFRSRGSHKKIQHSENGESLKERITTIHRPFITRTLKYSNYCNIRKYMEIFVRGVSRQSVARKFRFRSQNGDCVICVGPRAIGQGFLRALKFTPSPYLYLFHQVLCSC